MKEIMSKKCRAETRSVNPLVIMTSNYCISNGLLHASSGVFGDLCVLEAILTKVSFAFLHSRVPHTQSGLEIRSILREW